MKFSKMTMAAKKDKKTGDIFSVKSSFPMWLRLATVFFILIVVIGGGYIGYIAAYAGKFYPGVKIGYLEVAGLTKQQALDQLKEIEKNVNAKGLDFDVDGKTISINPITAATDPDLARQLISFNWNATIDAAYGIGRGHTILTAVDDQLRALAFGMTVPASVTIDQTQLYNTMQASFSQYAKPPLDARLEINGKQFDVIGEQSGYEYNYDNAIAQLKIQLAALNFNSIKVNLAFKEPDIKKQDVTAAIADLPKILAVNAITLTSSSTQFTVGKSQFNSWLEFQRRDTGVVLSFNRDLATEYLKSIAEKINVESHNITLKVDGDKITDFQPGQDGFEVDIAASYQQLINALASDLSKPIPLVVNQTRAAIDSQDIKDLGITELIGRGTSNFAGSPKNRRHNIAVGAKSLNGILIKPGEEFSLLKALGSIDGDHGYLTELVIKGDRTVPEFGGGLCQIGTTTFRVALNAGLPITQRRSHSYRVVYYEPAGMDATIYDPAPDMRFINDTGNNILFITKINGDNLVFEFYGTKDGRTVDISPNPPKIYNVVSPGAPRNIETTDLKPGVKKKVESAHKGADTYFKYTVTYPNGEVKSQDFYSHYIPWQEVWLVGVAETTATSTPTIDVPTADAAPAPAPAVGN